MLVSILILVLILVVAFWIIGEMSLPHPINMIVRVVVGIVGLIYLLNLIGVRLP